MQLSALLFQRIFLSFAVAVLTTLILVNNGTRIINVFDKPFKVFWNVPTFQCHGKGIYFEALNAKYGIITNTNGSFKGDKIIIMYDPGYFPAILDIDDTRKFLRNGGVPQEGNLSLHLEAFAEKIRHDFPNESYNGIAVIDFESWRPVFRQNWATLQPYKDLSYDIERANHPTWSEEEIRREAQTRFEGAGREFVDETLRLAKELRPNATWGYYAYPYCFNMQAPNFRADCSKAVQLDNNKLEWMFEESLNLHPSLYLSESLTMQQRQFLMAGRIEETLRVREQSKMRGEGMEKQIFPYFWYLFRDTENYMPQLELSAAFQLIKRYELNGIIIWGSSADVNSKGKCQRLYNYVDSVLGPTLLKNVHKYYNLH